MFIVKLRNEMNETQKNTHTKNLLTESCGFFFNEYDKGLCHASTISGREAYTHNLRYGLFLRRLTPVE